MQRIFRLLLVASAIIIGGVWFMHWSRTRALNSGDVHVRETAENKTPKPENTETATATQPTPPQDMSANRIEPGNTQPDQSATQQDGVANVPTAQPITRTPQAEIVNVAGGKFQLYRQGDITFRLNTETGQACVLFATEAQWSKTVVYEHGCRNH